jgi:hypothetical protein
VTVWAYSGTPRGGFFAKNSSPSMPVGNRWSVIGRCPTIGMNQGPTVTKYSARSSLVMPGTRPELPTRARDAHLTGTVRTGTSSVVASLAAMPPA